MRNPRPGPTLSTKVSTKPVPCLGLPGARASSPSCWAAPGQLEQRSLLWEVAALLFCPHMQELEAKPGTASPAWDWDWEGEGLGPPSNMHSLFSSWRLWDPPTAEQGASLRCRVQIQGEKCWGLQCWGGKEDLLGQEALFICWGPGPVAPRLEGISAARGVAKHSVPVNVSSPSWSPCPALAVASFCSLLKAGVCSITCVGNWLPEPCAHLAPHYSIGFGTAGWQGCTRMDHMHLASCCIFSHITVSHRKVKVT